MTLSREAVDKRRINMLVNYLFVHRTITISNSLFGLRLITQRSRQAPDAFKAFISCVRHGACTTEHFVFRNPQRFAFKQCIPFPHRCFVVWLEFRLSSSRQKAKEHARRRARHSQHSLPLQHSCCLLRASRRRPSGDTVVGRSGLGTQGAPKSPRYSSLQVV